MWRPGGSRATLQHERAERANPRRLANSAAACSGPNVHAGVSELGWGPGRAGRAGRAYEEFNGSGILILGRLGDPEGRTAQRSAQRSVNVSRRRDLNDLLVSQLDLHRHIYTGMAAAHHAAHRCARAVDHGVGGIAMVCAPCRPVRCGCSIYRRTEQSRSNRWTQLP